MKYGSANSNWKGGSHERFPGAPEVKIALAKALLIKVMTSAIRRDGKAPFTNDEAAWAMTVVRERPEWAVQTLDQLGFK